MTMKIANKKIKEIMDEKGLVAIDLAYKMRVRESWVYAVLAGNGGKTLATVSKFAEALGVNPKDLIE